MSWALGLTLACLWLVAIYLILEFLSFAKRGGSDDYINAMEAEIAAEQDRESQS